VIPGVLARKGEVIGMKRKRRSIICLQYSNNGSKLVTDLLQNILHEGSTNGLWFPWLGHIFQRLMLFNPVLI
jgi:hypothetical protein